HVFEVHVDAGETHVGDFVQFLEAGPDHFADFGGGPVAFGGFVHHGFDFVHGRLEFGCSHRAPFACFPQALKNFLGLEALPPAILLDHHIRNLVDALVGGETTLAFQAFTAATNHVARAAFARVNHFVIKIPAERAFHPAYSPLSPA